MTTPSASTSAKRNPVMVKSLSENRLHPCSDCKRAFSKEEGLKQHYRALHPGRFSEVFQQTCNTCQKSFPGLCALEDHQRAKAHCYCQICTIFFTSESKAVTHFETFHASQFRCCDCERDFPNEDALEQHLANKVHRRIPCQVCEQDFGSKPALDRHIVKEHHASVNPKREFWPQNIHGCYICQRRFLTKVSLDQHLTSLKHHPLSDLGCVTSDKCKRRFLSPSALLHHLESGTCRSGVDRDIINNLVQDNDVERIISSGPNNSHNLLPDGVSESERSSSTGTPVLTPTSSEASSPVMAATADNSGDQPLSFQSLGASSHSASGSITPTSSHMHSNLGSSPFQLQNRPLSFPTSSAHSLSHYRKSPLFHCPGALTRSTPHGASPRNFTTLSGLAQHIESGACGEGTATLKKAMDFVQERLEKMGLGSIRLLK